MPVRLFFLLGAFALAAAACPQDEKTPPGPAPPAAVTAPGTLPAALQQAVDKWRAAPALSAQYRSVRDTTAAMGRVPRGDKGTMLNVHEGTYAREGQRALRTRGTQTMSFTGKAARPGLEQSATIDVLYKTASSPW